MTVEISMASLKAMAKQYDVENFHGSFAMKSQKFKSFKHFFYQIS